MDEKIIEAILKLLPFGPCLQYLGLNEEQSAALSVLLAVGLLWGLYLGVKKAATLWELRKNARNLMPQFDYQSIRQATRIYIPTQYQNAAPSRQDEPGFTHQYVARNPLIPFFIQTAFDEKADQERFYLILADSGMGKTTFMINLYLRYHSPFNRRLKHKMRLFRFSNPDTLPEVKAIPPEEARNTILLLDALDEDPGIVSKAPGMTDAEAFQRRVNEIVDVARYFREVVMTCRTQYFPGQEDDPYEINIRRPDEKGFYRLNKLYLSPFTDEEVRRYLRKKYGRLPFIHRRKKARAADIVKRSRLLLMRPMMLSYIDMLIDGEAPPDSLYGIYEALIEKWLQREGEKRRKTGDRPAFIDNLRRVSLETAKEIHAHWTQHRRLYLTKEEAVAIAARHDIELRPEEVTGQSLLTCDGAGNWKFAHKSVFEFFLARLAINEPTLLVSFHFTGMDVARQFLVEKNILPLFVPIKGGEFLMGSPEDELEREADETQHLVRVDDFYMSAYPVTLGQFEQFVAATGYETDAEKGGSSRMWNGKKWEDLKGVNWRHDVKGKPQPDKRHPVIHVSWNDASAYAAWLSERTKAPCRLPTEAEWEYAGRAGTQTPFYTGQHLSSAQANYNGNFPYNSTTKGKFVGATTPVGSYPPNPWGLYDMHGNVWEWCADWYGEHYYEECKALGVVENPTGPKEGVRRVDRGGSWGDGARLCRVANRNGHAPSYRVSYLGFRLVRSFQSAGLSSPAFP